MTGWGPGAPSQRNDFTPHLPGKLRLGEHRALSPAETPAGLQGSGFSAKRDWDKEAKGRQHFFNYKMEDLFHAKPTGHPTDSSSLLATLKNSSLQGLRSAGHQQWGFLPPPMSAPQFLHDGAFPKPHIMEPHHPPTHPGRSQRTNP